MAFLSRRSVFLVLCACGLLGRLYLVGTTYGTNDVNFWSGWASFVRQLGILKTYELSNMINHPPPALAFAGGLGALARRLDLPFIDLFRLTQVIFDCVAATALHRIGARVSIEWGRRLALFVMLSPGAAFLSAFHGNTDPMMIALIVTAAALVGPQRWRAVATGLVLALATSVKIVPLLLLPLFFIAIPRAVRIWFAGAFGSLFTLAFLPAVVLGGPIVARRIFGYAGSLPNEWGITGIFWGFGTTYPALRPVTFAAFDFYYQHGRFVVYAALLLVLAMMMRRGLTGSIELLHGCGIVILTMFTFTPGFGVQYLAWLIPLLPFVLSWRGALALNGVISLFLFIVYSFWAGGWPWWYATVIRPGTYRFVTSISGYAMWFIVCFALVGAVRRFRRQAVPAEA